MPRAESPHSLANPVEGTLCRMNTLRRWRAAGGYGWWERRTDLALSLLAVVFVIALILPLAHPLTPAETQVLDAANMIIWVAFAADYVVRLYLAPGRWQFVRQHPLDLVVVLVPFLRPLRLARLARLARLVRVGALVVTATRRSGARVVRRVTVFVGLVAAIVLSTGAVIVYDAERRADGNIHSLSDAFWWALTTVTTVGYGDRYPVTTSGRVTAAVLMLTGIALAGVLTASIAAWFVNLTSGGGDTTGPTVDQQGGEQGPALMQQMSQLLTTVDSLRSEVGALRADLGAVADRIPQAPRNHHMGSA